MKKVGTISLLPEEINEYSLNLRKEIAKKFGLDMFSHIPAHITFKYRFPVKDVGEIEKLVSDFVLFNQDKNCK